MLKPTRSLLAAVLFLQTGAAFAVTVTLQWDPETAPDLAGYKVYYKADEPSLPFDGVGAHNGPSPVFGGLQTTYTLSGLPSDHNHYFAVTAFNTAGVESPYSNIVTVPWAPVLLYPAKGQTDVPLQLDLSWRAFAAPADTTYTVYYGTDPALLTVSARLEDSGSITPGGHAVPSAVASLGALLALAAALGAGNRVRQAALRLAPAGATLALTACVLSVGCGPRLIVDSGGPRPGLPTRTLEDVRGTSAHASDLLPNTTYYWKVVGHSGGERFESATYSFTTGR